ncbi:MAG: nucleotidyl transferase AbiEii/AbiGii toxin family protein [Opitutaceae bacterium]|nr:nucleotidyl transferase AbiEii/AbiGii toxin family protein [Opitutaceae bacterium]
MKKEKDFAHVVGAGVALQQQLPWMELVAVGGTAAALHAHHRVSYDVDFVSRGLKENFEKVLNAVNEWTEWQTNRAQYPVLILGEAHAIEIGIRQAYREKPIQTISKQGLVIPTIEECFRIKSFLLLKRRATRDFIDVCALLDKIGDKRAAELLASLDTDFPSLDKLSNTHHFAAAIREAPVDRNKIQLAKYKGLQAPYTDWGYIDRRLQQASLEWVARRLAQPPSRPPETP